MSLRAVTGAVVAGVMVLVLLTGCSRERLDWKSAEAADTVEAYDNFIKRHPDSELATQARARVAQLQEDRDWQRASTTDTLQAYKQFLAQHENGKWAAEARIRIENFALDGTATGPARPSPDPEPYTVVPVATPAAREPEPQSRSAATSASPQPTAASAGPPRATPSSAVTSIAAQGAPAAPAATSSSGFGIQLGAFRSQEAAFQDWKRVQVQFDAELQGLFAKAVPVQSGAGQLFRLQSPVGDEARARAICAALTKRSQPCVVVLPQPPR